MPEEMPEDCAQDIVDTARAGLPREICGFVTYDWDLVPIANVSVRPTASFTMDPDEQLEWMFHRAHMLLGIYHSHPSGLSGISETDKLMLRLHPNLRFWIATVSNVYEWVMLDDEPVQAQRDGTPGTPGVAYPVLASAEALRRTG